MIEGGYVSADYRSRLLVAKPEKPPFDAGFSRELLSRLEALRARPIIQGGDADAGAGDEPRSPVDVQFAGGHRIAVETESVIRRESIVNTAGSLALILPLLYLVFRSPWLVVVGSIPSGLSLLIVLGVLGLGGATLSAAATASSAMLFGLGVDGVVLLYVAYTLALGAGADPPAAIDGLAGPGSSMLLGMWTTAATFYGLVFVDFPSLEQLGTLDRPQHGALRRADARPRCRVAAADAVPVGRRDRCRCRDSPPGSRDARGRFSCARRSSPCSWGRQQRAFASIRRSIACDP